jgi:hypothetical protein
LIVLGLVVLARSHNFSLSVIHGVHLGEEPVGVVSQLIRISQNMLHSAGPSGHCFQSFVLLNQSILKSNGVLIEDSGSFDAEVINDGGGCLA